jgi:hypothetical protein
MQKPNQIVKPLRLDEPLDREIKRVGKVIGLNDADTMRKALERGLPIIEELFRSPLKKKAA